MNASEMITTLGQRWRDPTYQVKTRVEWLGHLNKAYRRFVKRAKFPMSSAYTNLSFAAGTQSMPLPADAWAVGAVYDVTSGTPLYPIYSRDQAAHLFDAEPGAPEGFSVEDNDLFLYPPPRTALTVRVQGMSVLTDLADSIASTPVIPAHYHHALLDGAMEIAFRDDQNAELAQAYAQDFGEAISDALREFTKPKGGRLVQLRNDYFETGVRPFRG